MPFFLALDLHTWMACGMLGAARIAPAFFMLPFLNSGVITGVVRLSAILIVAIGLWPHPLSSMAILENFDLMHLVGMLVAEVMIGIVLACLLSWPFWIFHALGSFIDNQRGATLSSSVDPANGVDTSELANFFNLFAAVAYLLGGGMQLTLELFAHSYRLCDPLTGCELQIAPLMPILGDVMSRAVVLASPVVAALLLTEVLLGLLSRFAPQMNAFSIALTIKSAVAFLILLLYFGPVLPSEVIALAFNPAGLANWFSVGTP
ncbi:type III secretion system export apparatus subunit SctT [Glaciimonas sp. PCH181]|uniref:type III secretion system export apparatus subunit SctT n=1 Tax=Glaciimonas sp. PCH181 TaxID=2133943 RepID=UPI000D377744|nr:type III secretion system export apparatus subunit SctT [Glaciimonas sp. PCH181]PUA19946.1 EscT/YscT/HrcT family type III secretion system export apparatus protein [Glaciimonas sp. PCH181]